VADGILASVGMAERPLGDGVRVTTDLLAPVPAVATAAAPPAPADPLAVAGRWPPAAPTPALFAPLVPRAAQLAVSMMAPSTAAVVSAPDNPARRRLPFRPNITSILPACTRSVPETHGGAGR
jgi:hypothetical protein